MRGTFTSTEGTTAATVAAGLALLLVTGGCRGIRGEEIQEIAETGTLGPAPVATLTPLDTPAPTTCGPCVPPSPGAPALPVVTRVRPEDTLRGHLNPDQGSACFYFEGVEYALLDVDFATDTTNAPAPRLTITDPDGGPVDLTTELGPDGSSCQKARGVVLRKSGTYRGLVSKAPKDPEHFWTFRYDLRFAPPDDERVHLVSCDTRTLAFTAAKGSRVIVTVTPEGRSGLVPRFAGVADPRGGRALDPAKSLPGAPAPMIKEGRNGERVLDFNAPQAGRYTVTLCAEPGTEGIAVTNVQVFPPKPAWRMLLHDNHPTPGEHYTPAPCRDGACPAAPGVAPTASR